jgi:two-component system OmpR family response regulator
MQEVIAQMEVFRRIQVGQASHIMTYGDLTLDVSAKLAWCGPDQERLVFPRREFDILETLMRHKETRVTKQKIYNTIYNIWDGEVDVNVVESHMSKMRTKLRNLCRLTFIDSKRNYGYMLTNQPITIGYR